MRGSELDPATVALPDAGVLVAWCAPLADDVAAGLSTSRDLAHVAGLREPADRARSLTAAWLLRQVAGAALGLAPRDVVVGRTCPCGRPEGGPGAGSRPHGRPRVGDGTVDVSVTHAGSVVGVAVARRGRVGLDVEPRAAFAGDRAAQVLAAAATAAELAWARSGDDVGSAAGRLWVRKEALLKATGHGLAQDPRTLSLDQARGVLLGWPFPGPVAAAHVLDLDPGAGSPYLGALALLDPATADDVGVPRRAAPAVRVVHVPPLG